MGRGKLTINVPGAKGIERRHLEIVDERFSQLERMKRRRRKGKAPAELLIQLPYAPPSDPWRPAAPTGCSHKLNSHLGRHFSCLCQCHLSTKL